MLAPFSSIVLFPSNLATRSAPRCSRQPPSMTLRFHFTRQPPRTVINLVQGIRVGLGGGVVVNYRCVTSIILKRINVNRVGKEAMVYTGQVSREPYNDVGWNRGYSIAVPCRLYVRKCTVRSEDQLIPREDSTPPRLCPTPFACREVLRPLAMYRYTFNEAAILIPRYSTRHLDEIYRRPDCGKQTAPRLGIGSRFKRMEIRRWGRNILKFGIKWEIIGSESIEHFA